VAVPRSWTFFARKLPRHWLPTQLGKTGLAPPPSVKVYVTDRALAGLWLMIVEEEKAIRRDPLTCGHKIIGKVLGSLK